MNMGHGKWSIRLLINMHVIAMQNPFNVSADMNFIDMNELQPDGVP